MCHDALYFFPDKPAALAEMRRIAGPDGRILIGHAHNALVDQGGVAGSPLAPHGYASLVPKAVMYDDADLTAAFLSGTPPATSSPAALR